MDTDLLNMSLIGCASKILNDAWNFHHNLDFTGEAFHLDKLSLAITECFPFYNEDQVQLRMQNVLASTENKSICCFFNVGKKNYTKSNKLIQNKISLFEATVVAMRANMTQNLSYLNHRVRFYF